MWVEQAVAIIRELEKKEKRMYNNAKSNTFRVRKYQPGFYVYCACYCWVDKFKKSQWDFKIFQSWLFYGIYLSWLVLLLLCVKYIFKAINCLVWHGNTKIIYKGISPINLFFTDSKNFKLRHYKSLIPWAENVPFWSPDEYSDC